MTKRFYSIIKAVLFFIGLGCGIAYSQTDRAEEAFSYWGKCLENARDSLKINQEDFLLFCRFDEAKLASLRAAFMREPGILKIALPSMQGRLSQEENNIIALYKQFEIIKTDYPSSVNEYRKNNFHNITNICDTSGCNNIGFEQGTLSGWNAYYGYNYNTGIYNFFNLTNITGGPVGPVTEAANDTLTSTPGYYSVALGPEPRPDYQVSLVSGARYDNLVPNLPVVSPYGGLYSVMLGDSTQVNFGAAILTKTFLVKPNNTNFTYQYAVVLENPYAHSYYQQPFFQVALLDQKGDTIPGCGKYAVVSSGGKADGFNSVFVPVNGSVGGDTAYYKNWTVVCVPLKKYIGQCITIIFEVGDCSKAGHFGYAYVDASCTPLEIIPSSPSFCGQKTITLTGPPGFTGYIWSGPPGGIKGSDSTQTINIDSAGHYQLIAVPVTGLACADTLSINIIDTTGPPPVPSFTINTVCAGEAVKFTNTSKPLNGPGIKFYWDFYNLGTYQDSSVNPSWTFSTPGIHYVKLYEIKNGCGTDTVIPVKVVPAPTVIITAPSKVCQGDSVTLTAVVTSSYLPFCFYKWNTGANTRSITVFPNTLDTTLYVTVTSGCTDTFYHKISVVNVNPLHTCCDTTMLPGDTTTIVASGEKNYVWLPNNALACATCPSTRAYPIETTTYTVTGTDSNGCRFTDTVRVNIESCKDVYIPNAFTPNHNGLNDTFGPAGRCIKSYCIYMFDRWGNLIYSNTQSMPWNGMYKGRRVQEDAYVYQIVVTTWDLYVATYVGGVTVLR